MENLIKEFYKTLEAYGVSKESTLKLEYEDGVVGVVIGEELDDNSVRYNTVFFEEVEDGTEVNVVVQKQLESKNELEILRTINELNSNYSGVKFYTTLDCDCVYAEIFVPLCEDVVFIINALTECRDVASIEFVNFK